jgi:hypothetical protein
MEAVISDGQIGPEAKYDVAFKGGKLVLSLDYQGKMAGAGVSVSVDANAVISAIEAAIPGKLDDAVLELLRGVLAK